MGVIEPADGQSPGTAGSPLLTARGVSKRYGAVQALDGVDLDLHSGEVVAVLGENGAGKSTLMGVLAGSVVADAGELAIAGIQQRFQSPLQAQRAGIRLVPQELLLVPQLSAAENITLGELPARGGRLDRRAMRSEAERRLAALGVELEVRRPVERLSVVQQAFVQIARAMAPGTRILIVDEATAPMSADEAQQLFAAIKRVAADGVAVLYISHRLGEVGSLASRIVVLRDGRLAGAFVAEQGGDDALVRAMVGDQDLTVGDSEDPQHGEQVLRVQGLSTSLLRGVSLAVCAGEILGVYGVAGSGREELGPALVGARGRSGGEVMLAGACLAPGRVRAALEAGVGYVPAERRTQGLVLDRSIAENIALSVLDRETRRGLLRRRALRRLAERYVAQLDIASSSVDAPVRSLSGGSQQKVLLARCLAAESRALVLDEPTRGVDVAAKAEIYRTLHALANGGVAVLVISSDLEEIATIADRALVLLRGQVIAELSGPDLSQEALTRVALLAPTAAAA